LSIIGDTFTPSVDAAEWWEMVKGIIAAGSILHERTLALQSMRNVTIGCVR
jgi:hypothetical protein